MRRGFTLLALCTAVAVGISCGFADDPNPTAKTTSYGSQKAKRTIQYFSKSGETATRVTDVDETPAELKRYSRSRTDAVPSVPNYSAELFGGKAKTAGSAQPAAEKSTEEKLPLLTPSKTSALPEVRQIPLEAAAATAETSAPGIVHAAHAQTDSDKPVIKHTAADFRLQLPAPEQAAAPAGPAPIEIDPSKTGPQQPAVRVQWIKNGPITVGQECSCTLQVENTGSASVSDVEVLAHFPATIRLTNAQPQPAEAGEFLKWRFADLAAQEVQTISLQFIPAQRGDLQTAAFVRFTGQATGLFNVEEPLLALAMTGPKEVMLGDPASQLLNVSNPGTGPAHNVVVETTLPAGLEHPRGERLYMEIGTLNPGESRTVRLGLAAVEGGKHALHVVAKADGGLQQIANAEVNVITASLQVAAAGPSLRYIGRSAKYELQVHNDGGVNTNNVRVVHRVPAGYKFESADRGGEFDAATGNVSWFLGQLKPDQTETVSVTLQATKLGDYTHEVVAAAEHGVKAGAVLETKVDGTASLALELVDLEDPVEVGVETGYEVRVKNEGSKAAEQVKLVCELPAGMQLSRVDAPVSHLVQKELVIFDSLAKIEPGKTVTFRVMVKGIAAGSQRFRTQLSSASVPDPLTHEELTRFYQD